MNGKYDIKTIGNIIMYLGIFSICGIYIYLCLHAYPVSDDFGFMNKINTGDYSVSEIYFTWQGTWFTNFFIMVLLPIVMDIGSWGIRIFYIINFMFFIYSFWKFINSVLDTYHKEMNKCVKLFFYLLLVVCCFNIRHIGELFFWSVGIYAYTIAFSCTLLSISILIRMFKQDALNYTMIILMATLAIISTGVSLQITAIICYCYLLALIYTFVYKKDKKYKKVIGIIFIFLLIGAFINVLAPGNFVRAELIADRQGNETLDIFLGIENCIKIVCSELKIVFLKRYTFPIMFIIACIANRYIEYKTIKFPVVIMSIVSTGLLMLICIFPVSLGYSTGSNIYADRIYNILDFVIIIGTFIVILIIVGFTKQRYNIVYTNTHLSILFLILIVFIIQINSVYSVKNLPTIVSLQEIANGTISNYDEQWSKIFETASLNDNTIVEVGLEAFLQPQSYRTMGVSYDSEEERWILPTYMSLYYGKDNIYLYLE